MLFGDNTSYWGPCSGIVGSAVVGDVRILAASFLVHLFANTLGKVADNGTNTWVPATQAVNTDGGTGFRL